jgi:hypothetical protein
MRFPRPPGRPHLQDTFLAFAAVEPVPKLPIVFPSFPLAYSVLRQAYKVEMHSPICDGFSEPSNFYCSGYPLH